MSMPKKIVYLIGSLKNPKIPEIARVLRENGYEVVDDWYAPGPEADDYWQKYEKQRGRTYREALNGLHVKHVFEFDKYHLDRCDIAVLVMPAGKSAHLELGYAIGRGKHGFVLLDKEPERFDIMYRFADDVVYTVDELLESILHRVR
jgi:nucleoside 2-deoxyribosyltransferase